ncbi:hypothetical protein [Metabacillus indicus]|uniref:hypothetical protein n=1 Tax=Metabacillus indicus TaxID=246786 RepID=UPI0004931172|nr:hypothetical protein [Metabacillus indicus]KEZ51182.1 hypothetical protein AZ46_0211335 [Metabacillus indicus LMG 22858]
MKKLNQNGYALLNVLMVFTLVTIWGISLLSITISSQAYVKHSKTYLEDMTKAEKRLDEASAEYEVLLEGINNEVLNSQTLLTKLGSLEARIEQRSGIEVIAKTLKQITATNNLFVQTVDITAPVGPEHAGKKLKRTLKVSTIADIFNYGVVTNGDLTLNGAVDIKGNIFVQKRLYLSNRGKFIQSGTTYYPGTVYPSIQGDMTVKGLDASGQPYSSAYFYNSSSSSTTAQNFRPITNTGSLSSYFVSSPRIRDAIVSTNQINILGRINEKHAAYTARKGQIANGLNNSLLSGTTVYNTSKKFLQNLELTGVLNVAGDVLMEGNFTMGEAGRLITSGNVFINGQADLKGTIELTNPNSYVYINGKAAISNLNLDGQMYISDAADIRSDFNTNGTVYVEKNTSIENLNNVSGGTAVILSNGSMLVANNNEYSSTPKIIDAFLYSNETLEMYGVGSNIKIKGGVYGSNIILNATKGETRNSLGGRYVWVGPKWYHYEWRYDLDPELYNNVGGLYFEKNQQKPGLPSRLQIEFKEDLILNPPTGIPTVEKLKVETIDTEVK